MLQHFKYAFNGLKKNKTYSFINIVGLALGLGVAMALTLTLMGLLSIDKFHENKETVFKLYHKEGPAAARCSDASSALLAPALCDDLPEITDYCQFFWADDKIIGAPENHVKENGYYVDKGWFTMLSFPLTYGNPDQVLSKPGNIVISEKLSKKLFGDDNPVGKSVNLYSFESVKPEIFTVSGVFQDIKTESSLKFEFAIPFSHYLKQHPSVSSWDNIGTRSYIRVKEGTNPGILSKKITGLIKSKNIPSKENNVYG